MKKNKGVTFIELMVVVVILSVVSLALYSTFNNGIKIWQRINKQLPEEDLDIFFDRFSRDLSNSLKFTGINFLGTEKRLEFATLLSSSRLEKRTVGKVIYFYEPGRKVLNRQQKDFAQVYSAEEGMGTETLRNIKFLRLRYYIYDKEKKEYFWKDESSTGKIPLAVSIELELSDDMQAYNFTKTVSIPVGG